MRRLAIAVVLLAVAAIALPYFFLPRLIRPTLEASLAAALDAPVTIASLSWEPASGRAIADGIAIGAAEDANHVSVGRVVGEVSLARLWEREIVVSRLVVSDPIGTVELDDQYRPTVLPRDDDAGASAMVLPQVTIQQLEVSGGRLTVRYPVKSRLHDKLLRIDRLDSSNIIVTADGVSMQAAMQGALDDAPVDAQVRVTIDDVDADLSVSGLSVHRDAIDLPSGLETFRALVDAKAHYQSRTEPPSHSVQLDLRLAEPTITDAAGSQLAAFAITAPDLRIDLATRAIVAGAVAIDKPIGTLELDAQYQPALPRFGDASAAPSTADVTIREVLVTDGDLTVRYPVHDKTRTVPLRIARLTAADVRAAGDRVTLRATVEGTLDGAPVSGRVDLTGAPESIEAELRVSDLPVDATRIALPAGFESLEGKVDVHATYAKQAKGGDSVRLDARVAQPRLAIGDARFDAAALAVPDARLDLAARRVELGAVQIVAPVVELSLTPEGLSLPTSSTAGSDTPAWTVGSGRIDLRDGQLRLRRGDATVALRLQSLDWDGLAGSGPLALRAAFDKGGTMTARGTVGTSPLAATLDVELAAVALPPLVNVSEILPVGLSKGTAEGRFHVVYADGGLRVDGQGRLRDVHTIAPDRSRPTEVMAVADARAELSLAINGGTAIDVASLTLSYPYVLAQRHRGGVFPADLFSAAAAAPRGDAGAAPATVRVKQLTVEGGKVEFVDGTITPGYWTSLSDFRADATELRFPEGTVASFTVAGKQDELSPIQISGALTPRGLEATASMQDVLLPALNAYVSPLLGYDLTAGRLGFNVSVAPQPPLLAATANVILHGVEVRQTGVDVVQQQSGVPLPIALSLISKRSGVIDLTLPVTVDTKSRRVTLGSIVGQAIRNAIVTALTSPLRILGNLFGRDGAPHAFAVDPIPFPPGSATLDPAGTARLAAIARILNAHPGLVLVALPQITADDVAIVGDDAQELADGRGAAVRAALTGSGADPRLPEDRLTLVEWKPPKGPAPVEQPGVYVELQDQP